MRYAEGDIPPAYLNPQPLSTGKHTLLFNMFKVEDPWYSYGEEERDSPTIMASSVIYPS
jgi:hypothetical protein